MAKFKTIITTAGAAKIAAVLAGTASIVLDNTAKMAVGDGGGTLPTPTPAQTKLVNEVYRAPINRASIDTSNPKNIVVELVIPPEKPEISGFWIREMALYDAAGTLLAVGNMAETYKPSLSEGAGRKMVIRMVIAVSEVNAITITMDTSTVMATQDYVDSEIDKHAKSRNHPDATLTAKGFTQLSSSTTSTSETLAATPKAVKTVMDEAKLKAPLASPALTGTPTAPTATAGNNSQQLANTQFVMTAIAALVNSSPGALDTLSELAAALGNDPNFATTMLNALAAKAPLASPALTGKPTAPTAPQASNDTQLATTEFVTRAVAPALLVRGSIPAGSHLNNFGPTSDYTGVWSQSSVSATAADIANGYPAAERGVLEVYAGGRNNGTQRYTTDGGRIFIRWLNAVWNAASPSWSDWTEVGGLSSNTVLPASATLSDAAYFAQNQTYVLSGSRSDLPAGINGNAVIMSIRRQGGTIAGLNQLLFTTVGTYERHGAPNATTGWTSVSWYPGGDGNGWRLIGADAMAAIGLGITNQPVYSAFDWQQFDPVSGGSYVANPLSWLNAPNDVAFSPAVNAVSINVIWMTFPTAFEVQITANTNVDANYKVYKVRCVGAKGSRAFYVREDFSSANVIPLTSGGLGATTPEGGRKTLGFEELGFGLAPQNLADPFDWQQAAFVSGESKLVTVGSWLNAPAGISYIGTVAVLIKCVSTQANRLVLRVTSNAAGAASRAEYNVISTGVRGSRTFTVTQIYNSDSSTIIPVANGGTGGKTVGEALTNLGGAPLNSPALTGTPTAPTPAQTVNNTQIATTAFVKAALAALVNGSPAALDTLKELADALGGDANFSTTVLNALSGKQPINAALTSLSGLTGAADKLPYFVGKDLLVLSDFTAFARTLLSRNSAALVRADLNILTGPGWYKLGDLLIQYGTIDFTNTTTKTINFPIRYPTKVDQVIVSDAGWGGGNMWGATEQQPIGFTAHVNVSEEGGQWISFGR
ncbi:phage tail-collar fiber domain-containing protein [Leclercia adecarboxylata]